MPEDVFHRPKSTVCRSTKVRSGRRLRGPSGASLPGSPLRHFLWQAFRESINSLIQQSIGLLIVRLGLCEPSRVRISRHRCFWGSGVLGERVRLRCSFNLTTEARDDETRTLSKCRVRLASARLYRPLSYKVNGCDMLSAARERAKPPRLRKQR